MMWATRYPCGFRAVKLTRAQALDFFGWVVDERAWDGRIFMKNWREADFVRAIERWEQRPETDFAVVEVHFRDDADAVAFKLRYPDAIYR